MRYVAGLIVLVGCLGGLAGQARGEDEWDGWEEWRRRRQAQNLAGPQSADGFSDEAVKAAIQRGVYFLWSMRHGDGSWGGHGGAGRGYPAGPTSLAAYALLACGASPLEKRMAQTLDWLSKQESEMTYSLGLRCNVWLLADKGTGGKYRRFFRKDARQLVQSTKRGAYDYFSRGDQKSDGDNSNSQYGVLGTWAAKMARLEVPSQYWQLVQQHWVNAQKSDGGWAYRPHEDCSATMTAGGIATVFVCFDSLLADRFTRCNVRTEFKPIQNGLKWMDQHFHTALRGGLMGHGDLHYFLYGVERVGLASGYKYFGKSDWYKLGAVRLLGLQAGDGSWRGKYGPIVDTAFALLFLARGQHAIAFNKLEFKGDWNNRPRDLAGLTRWMTNDLERTLNWQIINLKVPVEEWHDAPILYLSGSIKPELSDEHLEKLRTYVWQGGTIFSATECGGRGFRDGIREVYGKLFPDYPLKKLPRDHELYTIHKRLRGWPPFYEIHNGIRPLVLHTDADLPKSWQLWLHKLEKRSFEAACNLLMYATDKGRLRPRGVSHWPPKPRRTAGRTIKVARLRYAGKWDPEPLAFERLRRLMVRRHGINLEVTPADVAQAADCGAPVATLTGTAKLALTSEELAALKRYVQTGGTLIVDAAGGSRSFAESAEVILRGMFGYASVRRLAPSADVFNLPGMKIDKVSYRRKARVALGRIRRPNLRVVQLARRCAVFFSKEDLTGGLVGYPCYTCVGYQPESCFEIMRNLMVFGAGGKPQEAGTAAAGRSGR
jgi:hypothetical protein